MHCYMSVMILFGINLILYLFSSIIVITCSPGIIICLTVGSWPGSGANYGVSYWDAIR